MFLNVKDMEVRDVRFDVTFQPGQIDFSEDELEQASPLQATGTAGLLANSEGELRIQGKISVEMQADCDRCLVRARFPVNASFDLFYVPASEIPAEDEVEIHEGDAELGFYEDGGLELEE